MKAKTQSVNNHLQAGIDLANYVRQVSKAAKITYREALDTLRFAEEANSADYQNAYVKRQSSMLKDLKPLLEKLIKQVERMGLFGPDYDGDNGHFPNFTNGHDEDYAKGLGQVAPGKEKVVQMHPSSNLYKEKPEKKERGTMWPAAVQFLNSLEHGTIIPVSDIVKAVGSHSAGAVSVYASMLITTGYLERTGRGYVKVVQTIPAYLKSSGVKTSDN